MRLAVAALLVVLVGCSKSKETAVQVADKSAPATVDAVTINPNDLWRAYGDNQIAADAKYKGKSIRITYPPSVIRADKDGRYFVGFVRVQSMPLSGKSQADLDRQFNAMTPEQQKISIEGYDPNVICYIAKSGQDKFGTIDKNKPITVVGRCRGFETKPGAYKDYAVVLDDCVLAD